MKKYIQIATVSALALVMGVSTASAGVNVWRDPVTKLTVSYADTWDQINNQKPGDVLTVRAPGVNEFAECKINITDDGRFKIYPVRYSGAIQRLNFSAAYWDGYLGQYDNVNVHEGLDNSGLGRGFASMVSASYDTPSGAKMRKRGIGFASLYGGKVYTVECSAEESAYHKWHNSFLGFVKAINFRQGTNFAISGYYRDFLQDDVLKVRGPTLFEDTYY